MNFFEAKGGDYFPNIQPESGDKIRGVNDLLVNPLGKDVNWDQYTLADLDTIRSFYGAVFSSRIYAGVAQRLEQPQFDQLYWPPIENLDREYERFDNTDTASLGSFTQKVHKVARLFEGLWAESIEAEEKDISLEEHPFHIDYQNFLTAIDLTEFTPAGFVNDNPELRSVFFNHIGTGADSLNQGLIRQLTGSIPYKYMALTGELPKPSTILKISRRAYKANDRAAATSFDVIDQIGNATISDLVLSLEELELRHSDEYATTLRLLNMQNPPRGCPFRRSGALLERYAGVRFTPNPLYDAYFRVHDIIEGIRRNDQSTDKFRKQ